MKGYEMSHEGGCLCGAVRFEIKGTPGHSGACHCANCRRWSGGVYLSIEVKPEDMSISVSDGLTAFASSDWAERAFCKSCGSSLWYKVTAPGPFQNMRYLGLGTLDDPNGLPLTEELFIDHKPDGYSFEQETRQITKAEFLEMMSGG